MSDSEENQIIPIKEIDVKNCDLSGKNIDPVSLKRCRDNIDYIESRLLTLEKKIKNIEDSIDLTIQSVDALNNVRQTYSNVINTLRNTVNYHTELINQLSNNSIDDNEI